jgi:ATP-dependent DNA helicase RecQ
MWPTGMSGLGVEVTGKIGPELSADPGRALGRLTDLGWGPRLRQLLDHAADAEVPDDMLSAVVTVLAGWQWAQRPAAIVSIPSRARPQLVASLARRVAEIGRLPDLGPLRYQAAPGHAAADGAQSQHNSAQRLRAVWRQLAVPAPMGARLTDLDGPVLLIDDLIDTGWTMTVAAMTLREAGARAVLPLVLAAAGNS